MSSSAPSTADLPISTVSADIPSPARPSAPPQLRRPQFPHHHPQIQPSLQQHPTTQPLLFPQTLTLNQPQYPLASSGRGMLPTPNPRVYPLSAPSRPISGPYSLRGPSPYFPPPQAHLSGKTKMPPSPFLPPPHDEHPSERPSDEPLVPVRGRHVRVSEGASIYALCRSWLKNGHPEESRMQYGAYVKSLPKPAPPVPVVEDEEKKGDEGEEEEEMEMELDEKAVESLSAKELLGMHVKRAKRVRARLREERLRRIARYKSRLALLLPPVMEQCGNDTSNGA